MDRGDQAIVRYYIEDATSVDEYVFDFVFDTLGLNGAKVRTSAEADISYINAFSSASGSSNGLIVQRDSSHVIWKELLDGMMNWPSLSKELSFDIFNAIAYFLKDDGNKGLGDACYDRHQRLLFKESFQYKNHIGSIPVVNKYVLLLRYLLDRHLQISALPLYPNGKKACIVLSHDVDGPDKHDELKSYPLFPHRGGIMEIIKHYRHYASLIKKYILDKDRSEYWNFDKIFEAERKYGFKSTSFFAVVNAHHKYGDELLDVLYSTKKSKFRRVFKSMRRIGFEIGSHAGYNAHKDLVQLDHERRSLSKDAKFEVIGMRHHYWHLGKDPKQTLLKHEQAGFKYDSSIAFNDHLGYRYSSALPFYPYHSDLKRKLKVLQIPVFCMDGNLFYDKGSTVEGAMSEFSEYLEILKECEGIGAIDWHIRSSYPGSEKYGKWGQAYMEILDLLAQHDDIWVTSAADYYRWRVNRSS